MSSAVAEDLTATGQGLSPPIRCSQGLRASLNSPEASPGSAFARRLVTSTKKAGTFIPALASLARLAALAPTSSGRTTSSPSSPTMRTMFLTRPTTPE